jgi:hypothetical protein
MSTVEHTTPPQSAAFDDWGRGPLVDHGVVAPQPERTEEAWREMPSDAGARPSSSAEAAFEAGRLVLLTLVALVILAPFAPGLILVGLAAAILAVPYLLVRRLFGQG